MKNIYLTIIILLCFVSNVLSQERYKVTYDYNTEKIKYYLLDKQNNIIDTLDSPKVKRNSLVEIQLSNVNPFAVDVITDVQEENLVKSGQGFNFSSLLGGISSLTSSDMNLNVAGLPATDAFSVSRGKSVTNDVAELNGTISNISALKTSLLANLLNPNMGKEAIMQNLLDISSSYEDARLPDPNENFYAFVSQLEKVVSEDKAAINSNLETLATDIEIVENAEENRVSRGELVQRNYALRDIEKMKAQLNQSTLSSIQNLGEIQSLYTMLEAASFERTYDYQLEADKVNIELKFIQSNFSEQKTKSIEQENTIKTRNIRLFSKGGFKINSSVALTLNNFGDNSLEYYVSDQGVIGADENNYFVPNLSTMINFYPFMGESFNIGGSFGLSIPISGEDNLTGVNFLLGPSMFFGSKSRLAISGGMAYGPVKKLTNGLQVGDATNFGSVDNFTRNVYDFGYYFGISFSLFDLN